MKLPKPFYESPGDYVTDITLLGWGIGSHHRLNKVTVKTISSKKCNRLHATSYISILKTHLCVGIKGGGKAECRGDSGSPAVNKDKVILGVASWSIKPCANPKYPGVYTKVSHYVDWIRSVTGIEH